MRNVDGLLLVGARKGKIGQLIWPKTAKHAVAMLAGILFGTLNDGIKLLINSLGLTCII